MNCTLLANRGNETFEKVVQEGILSAQNIVYIATAPIKDFVVGTENRKPVLFSDIVRKMAKRGIKFLILTSTTDLNKWHFYKRLKNIPNLHFARCLRNHMKMILIDERLLYIGSANITGAAMGKRKPNNVNFELGIITEDQQYLLEAQKYFLEIFTGKYCEGCKRQKDRRPEFYCSGIHTYRK